MLLHGQCRGVTTHRGGNAEYGYFDVQTIHVLDGRNIVQARVSKDFPQADLPKEDDDVVLDVVASAYASKFGPQVQVTALGRSAHEAAILGKRPTAVPTDKTA